MTGYITLAALAGAAVSLTRILVLIAHRKALRRRLAEESARTAVMAAELRRVQRKAGGCPSF